MVKTGREYRITSNNSNVTDSPYERLGMAVVLKAVHDYVDAVEKIYRTGGNSDSKATIVEVERFFTSGDADRYIGGNALDIFIAVKAKAREVLKSGRIPKGRYRTKILFSSLSA